MTTPTLERCQSIAEMMLGVVQLAPDASWCARLVDDLMLSLNKSSTGHMALYIGSYEQAPSHELCDRMATAFGAPSVNWERNIITTWTGRLHTARCHWVETKSQPCERKEHASA